MVPSKVGKHHFPSFRRRPESSLFKWFKSFWTPAFAGVMTFYVFINFKDHIFSSQISSTIPQFWIQGIPQPFAEQVKGKNDDQNCDTRYKCQPWGIKDKTLTI